ncbi:UPF0149 family protein [Rhodoferax sp. 4810]|nr:UPF0149 family protein [Rhodoferax jenense]
MQNLPNPTPESSTALPAFEPLIAEEFAELGAILIDLRSRCATTPSVEFAEGFLAALVCCRRQIPAAEYLPVLLALADPQLPVDGAFASASQQQRFMALWQRRWQAVALALDTPVAALDDPAAYQPQVLDARAALAALPEDERAQLQGVSVASFGQVWAQGFMAAVAAWPLEWAGPRNKAAAKWRDSVLAVVQLLTQDDLEPPTLSAFNDDDDGPPTVSLTRMNAFGNAIWAVYNMRQTWRSLGPRIETVHHAATPGRNDPCHCGSGHKYKKCCGGRVK